MALGRVDHHEAAAADVAGARIGHGHGKAGRDRGIDRIAAAFEHVGADLRRDLFLRHHHAVLGDDGMNVPAAGGVYELRRCSCALAGMQHAAISTKAGKDPAPCRLP